MLFKTLHLIVFCLALTACQTPIKVAGTGHKTVTEKWYELSRFSESKLPDYGIKVTAQLSLVGRGSDKHYILKNIQITRNENHFNINLLTPKFHKKFICSPVCMQLLEYEQQSNDQGKTLLNQYFERHEYELFKFYGHVYLLNEQLDKLILLEPTHIKEYLHYLATKNEKHESLGSFNDSLSRALSISEYRNYLENRNPLQQKLLMNELWSKNKKLNSNNENLNWKQNNENNTWNLKPTNNGDNHWNPNKADKEIKSWNLQNTKNENKHWPLDDATNERETWSLHYSKGGQVEENVLWVLSTNKETESWNPHEMKQKNTNNNISPLASWKSALKIMVQPGHTVCSYHSNIIGVVIERKNKSVLINLYGQAKKIVNGIIMDVDKGYLFGDIQKVSFLPMNKTKTFSIDEVAVCELMQ